MAEKEAMERRVYVLPAELVARIRQYQRDHAIVAEVEAVRRLLDTALLLRDDVHSLLQRLMDKFQTEKDIRIISRDILAAHPLVDSISNHPNSIEFTLKDGEKGTIFKNGSAFFEGHDGVWEEEQYIPF